MTTRLQAALLVVLALVAASCSKDPAVARDEFLASGDFYFGEKKYWEAVIEYSNAMQADPTSGIARFKLAEAYMANGDTRSAFPNYVRAADLLPDDHVAQNRAGHLLVNGGFFEEAKARARVVLTKDPENVEALLVLGNALAGLQGLEEASGVMARAVQIDPEGAGVYANLGVFQMASGDNASAEATFLKAVAASPESADVHLNLANLYRAMRRWPEAEQALKRALAVAPDSLPVSGALAGLYLQSGRALEAEDYLKKVVSLSEDSAPRFGLADYYLLVGRYADAVKTLEELATEPAHYAVARTRMAVLEYASGRPLESHRIIDEVLARLPRDSNALSLKARLLLAERQPLEALEHIKVAVQSDVRSVDALLTYGRILFALNRVDDARKALTDTLGLDARNLSAQLELAELHRRRREIDTALGYAENAVSNYPDNIPARLVLLRVLLVREDDHERAESELRALLASHPNAAPVHTTAGRLALNRNDLAGASRSFQQALRIDSLSIEALAGLAAIDLSLKNVGQARARVDGLLKRFPNAPEALLLAARMARMTGDLELSARYLTQLLAVDSSNPQAYGMLAEIYLFRGELSQAKAQFAELVRLEPESVAPPTMMGLLSYVERDLEGARVWWEKALALDPYAAAAANNLAWLYTETGGSLDVALQLALMARATFPDLAEINDTLGWVYYMKSFYAEALRYLERAAEQDPDNPLYHFHVGMTYAKQGQDARARRALQQALTLAPEFEGAVEARRTLATLIY